MKRRKLIKCIAIMLISMYVVSCMKNSNTEPDLMSPVVGNGSVSGIITDWSSNPVGNATVTAGTATTSTDANGKFTLDKVQFTTDTVVLSVIKSGFFQGSKNFVSKSKIVNDAKIQLIPQPAPTIISGSSGGNVTVSGGGSVNFNGGFLNASNGSAYTGNVSVSTIYLNATDQNFSTNVPGNLKGVSVSNQQGILQSFAVVAVEMNDASGNKLKLAQGKTATITLPIPVALQSNAPAAIPLWYFDDKVGRWIMEGTATRQGNNYVGQVNHFSFWSVGYYSGTINLRIIVTIDTGIVYRNKFVTITRPDSISTNGYTDNAGAVNGLVQVNQILTIKVFNDCGKNIFVKSMGPFNRDTTVFVNVVKDDCVSTDTSQYIRAIINGNNFFWQSYRIRQSFEAGSNTFMIGGSPLNASDTVFEGMIFGGNAAPGTYPLGILLTVKGTYTYQAGGLSYAPSYPYPTTVITKYDAIGGYIEGSFSGKIKTFPSIATADSFPLSGSYRLKRIQ